MDNLCYICKINNATEGLTTPLPGRPCPEAKMCKRCLNFIGKSFKELFEVQTDSYEFNPLSILRNIPHNKKSYALEKIKKILSLPEYFVFQEIKKNIRKVDSICMKCPITSYPLTDFYRIIEDINDFTVLCRHKARELTTHTLCNFCGIRYITDGIITKNGKHLEKKFKCFLCIEKKKIIDKIT